jgi:antitoxin CptB
MVAVPLDTERGRLAWRCRRGMKELDLLLTGYLRDHWTVAAAPEKAAFERILALPDPLLAAYLMQREAAPDPDLENLLAILRSQDAGRLSGAASTASASRTPGT